MGSASPLCEERHTSCELLLDIDKAPEAELALRSVAIPGRQTTLASVLPAPLGIPFNGHDGTLDDGEAVFHHACELGLEGIVRTRSITPAARRIGSR